MAIEPKLIVDKLLSFGINFFTGVPDSLLKEFCLCVDDENSIENHLITANEGCAIALATGHFLPSHRIPLVYMQNSGIGNAINPLLSLCDREVYSIPMLIMIGWRGEPGVKDEPQHVKQGKIQEDLLSTLEIPYEIISKDTVDFSDKISRIVDLAKSTNRPTALLVKKGTFKKFGKSKNQKETNDKMKREDALKVILDAFDEKTAIVSTTGKTSREIYEIREKNNQAHYQDFLTVGSMGHCSSIALGIALAQPKRKVICIDGDGSAVMHMGTLTSIANEKPKNLFHIVLNNEAHESVGGQNTSAKGIKFSKIVDSMNKIKTFTIDNKVLLKKHIDSFILNGGPYFVELEIDVGSRSDLGRPTTAPQDNKKAFMDFLKK